MDRRSFVAAAISTAIAPAVKAQESTEGLDMQAARAKMMSARGRNVPAVLGRQGRISGGGSLWSR